MKNIIVGGCGFIGSHLTEALVARGGSAVVIDNLFSGKAKNLDCVKNSERVKFYLADFTDVEHMREIFLKEKPDTLFNLATIGLIRSLKDPIWCFQQEVRFAEIACQFALENLYDRLIHFSSSEVYGNVDMPVIDPENHVMRPTTTYAAGKLAADNLICAMTDLYKLNSIIIRPFNNFGTGQCDIDYQGIIPKTISMLLKKRPVTIYGDGDQTRDFIFVDDMLKRMFLILRHHFSAPVKNRRKIYQICSEEEISINDLVRKIADIGKFKLKVEHVKERLGETYRLVGKQTQIPGVKFSPLTPIEDSIEYLVKSCKGEI